MPSAEILTPEKRFMALFVGESGSGKTVAACSFPKPIDVDDFDGRIRGLLGAPWIDRKGISYDYYPPRLSTGSTDTPNYVKINQKMESYMMMAGMGRIDLQTKVLDSLTSETFALLCDAIPLTHIEGRGSKGGKSIGKMQMAGPEDYGFEATGTYNLLSFLRSVPIPNVIVSAHYVDRYGKVDPNNDFSESVIVGKKLSVRDKIGTNIMPYFDHVFEFRRHINRYYVKFRGELARTSYASLPNDEIEITGKSLYDVMMSYIQKDKPLEVVK